jgi:hypothetical protein
MNGLLERIDPIARKFGLYTSYELDAKEYIGKANPSTVVQRLQEAGYEAPPTFLGVPLAASKTHPETNTTHDVTLRKIDPKRPRSQWHIHIWFIEDTAEVFSHYEHRPDIRPIAGESWIDMKTRLKTHYRPIYGDDYLQGVASNAVVELTSQ